MNSLNCRLLTALLLALTPISEAQTFEAVYIFSNSRPSDDNPRSGLVEGNDSTFYGTTDSGIYKLNTNGLTPFATFDGTNGTFPKGELIQGSDGGIYGTTRAGGANGLGTVFTVTTNGVLTSLASFQGNDGREAKACLVQTSDGAFYGTTSAGGANDLGTVFKLTTSKSLVTLVSFDGSNGGNPEAGLIEGNDGNLYGTTTGGGDNNLGTVFKITTEGALTTLVSFNGSNGSSPRSRLTQGSDGIFYGMTYSGGQSNYGTIFKMTPTGVLTTLRSFNGFNGINPRGDLVQGKDGHFYGATGFSSFGLGSGRIFRMSPTGQLTSLVPSDRETYRPLGLNLGSDGNLYWVGDKGGSLGSGVVTYGGIFKLVFAEPEIVAMSGGENVILGQSTTFSVTASGSALSYQWRLNGTNIPGAIGSSYSVDNASSSASGNYSIVAANAGRSITSEPVHLSVWALDQITGIYNGLFYETNDVAKGRSGFLTFTVGNTLKFNGRIHVDGFSYPVAGQFGSNSFRAHINVKLKNKSTVLGLDMQLIEANGSTQVIGTVSDNNWTAPLLGDRAYYSLTNPCPHSGNYAMTLFGSGDGSTRPNYGSRGIVNVKTDGTISLSGVLGDDAKFAQTTRISKDGQWPLYAPLYSTKGQYQGSLLGWITFTNQADSRLQGNLSWIKTSPSGKYYWAGFTNHMTVIGSIRQ